MSDLKVHNCHNNSSMFNTKDWVEYKDHLAQIKQLQSRNDELEERNKTQAKHCEILFWQLANKAKECNKLEARVKAADLVLKDIYSIAQPQSIINKAIKEYSDKFINPL